MILEKGLVDIADYARIAEKIIEEDHYNLQMIQ